LFPHGGSTGWSPACKRPPFNLTFGQYMVSRCLMPQEMHPSYFAANQEIINHPENNKHNYGYIKDGHFFPINSINTFYTCGMTYMVEQMSRSDDFKIAWQKMNIDHIFGQSRRIEIDGAVHDDDINDDENFADREIYRGEDNDGDGNEINDGGGSADFNIHEGGPPTATAADIARRTEQANDPTAARFDPLVRDELIQPQYDPKSEKSFLSDSFHGSKKMLKKKALNALHTVSQHGGSSFFLTLTFNKDWPECKEYFRDGMTAFNQPYIANMIFKLRLQKMIALLRSGLFFGGLLLAFLIYVIEYQERGFPHAHICFRLDGYDELIATILKELETKWEADPSPNKGERPTNTDAVSTFIDEHISAVMPDPLKDPVGFEKVYTAIFFSSSSSSSSSSSFPYSSSLSYLSIFF